jgi:GntR family transcriptional regulator, transcriptional repressor for pyruvate dehydrogenase complex
MSPMLKVIKKTRIYEEVVGQLHQLIDAGKLKAGDRLPSERELAETFRVSRSSVREAIKTLENEGLVITRPGSGTFVTTVNVEAIIPSLASLLSRGKDALIDLFEMRCLVEPSIAALAAERATPADILRLKEICAEQERQIKRDTSAVDSDAAFHLTIGRATHNSALQRLVASIVEILKPIREKSLQTPGRAHKSLASHREILVAIERHDPELARRAMQQHIQAVEQNVLAPTAQTRGRRSPAADQRHTAPRAGAPFTRHPPPKTPRSTRRRPPAQGRRAPASSRLESVFVPRQEDGGQP